MIKIKKKVLEQFLKKMELEINESWTGASAMPQKPDSRIFPEEAINAIQPATERQVSDTTLPVSDEDWVPKHRKEMGMAMKQMADYIPDSQIKFVWKRLKKIIDKSINNTDITRVQPKIEDMNKNLKE